jgi:osmotically-inducible protein OsmY
MVRRILSIVLFLAIVGGALAASKKTDAEVLTKVGRTASVKVMAVMPEREQIAGPLAKVQFGALTNVDERVRARLRTDATLDATRITVRATGGVVTLGGKADTSVQRERAVHLTQTTTGVTQVVQEIAVPEGR